MMHRFSSSKRSALLAAEPVPAPFAGFISSSDHEGVGGEAARRAAGSMIAAPIERSVGDVFEVEARWRAEEH